MLLAAISGVGLAPAVSAPPPVDDDFASVALLYPFDESDGSTATDDKSNSDHTALFLAGAEIDDAQKKFGNASLKLNGNDSSGRLQIVDSADWHFADVGFTVEAWVRFSVAAVKRGVIVSHYNANSTGRSWIFGISASQQLFLTYSENSGSTTTLASAAQTINSDAWAHYAVTRDSNENLRLFFGGTEVLNSSLAGSPSPSDAQRWSQICTGI